MYEYGWFSVSILYVVICLYAHLQSCPLFDHYVQCVDQYYDQYFDWIDQYFDHVDQYLSLIDQTVTIL